MFDNDNFILFFNILSEIPDLRNIYTEWNDYQVEWMSSWMNKERKEHRGWKVLQPTKGMLKGSAAIYPDPRPTTPDP